MSKFKKLCFCGVAIIVVGFILSIPFIINESYKCSDGYITMWGADTVLSFYGSFLAFLGTVTLGIVAYLQNRQINNINTRLLKLQTQNYMPYFQVISKGVLHEKIKDMPANDKESCNEGVIKEGSNYIKKYFKIIDYRHDGKNLYSKLVGLRFINKNDCIINNVHLDAMTLSYWKKGCGTNEKVVHEYKTDKIKLNMWCSEHLQKNECFDIVFNIIHDSDDVFEERKNVFSTTLYMSATTLIGTGENIELSLTMDNNIVRIDNLLYKS